MPPVLIGFRLRGQVFRVTLLLSIPFLLQLVATAFGKFHILVVMRGNALVEEEARD